MGKDVGKNVSSRELLLIGFVNWKKMNIVDLAFFILCNGMFRICVYFAVSKRFTD